MKNIIISLFALFILISCGDSSTSLSPLDSSANILAFGDSLTEGYGVKEAESYPAYLTELTNRNVINAGISGEVSKNGLRRLPGLLDMHEPDLVVICHGGNDILKKQSMSAMKANVMEMIALSQAAGADVILLGVPNFGLFLSSHDVYVEIAEQTGVVFLDELIPDILSDNSLKSDTVHPNAKGYQVMAETIFNTLKNNGAL